MKQVSCKDCKEIIKVPVKCNVQTKCSDCKIIHNKKRDKLWRVTNPSRKEYEKIWKRNQFSKLSECEKLEFYNKRKNKENYKELKSKWDKTYNCKHRVKINAYKMQRYYVEPLYKQRALIRTRIKEFLFRTTNKVVKSEIKDIIGLDNTQFKKYIGSKFTKEMNWTNYGKLWEIDHIVPLISANTIEEIKELSHFKNLQPLSKKDNLTKGGKIKNA